MKFTENVDNNPLSSKKFWKRIDKIKNDGRSKNFNYPKMIHNNTE